MSIAQKLARGAGLSTNALGGTTVVEQLFGGMLPAASESGEYVSVDRAATLPAVFRAIRLLSEPTGALPLMTYSATDDGRERASDHPAYELLHEQPNPGMTAVEFWTMLFNHFASWGRMYIGKEFIGGRDFPSALHAIEPSRMTVERLNNGQLVFHESLRTGLARRWSQRDLIYIRLYTVDGVNGVSPIGLQRETIGMGLAMRKHGARFFRDFAIPPGFLKVKEEIKDADVRERMRKEFMSRIRGNREIGLLDNGAEFETVGIPIKDLQFLEL